jgi:YidC/Oxa1 family membrane protein insertase
LKAHGYITSTQIAKADCNKISANHHVASFLFINDITAKASGIVLIVLMVLYVGTMITTSVMMSVGSTTQQRLMSIGLPVVFVIFVIQFPAGLLVYWIATNFTMIPQQYFNIRRYGRPNAPVKVETNGRGAAAAAREAIKTPTAPPPKARARRKRSGRRR